jgi:hypothetical protein
MRLVQAQIASGEGPWVNTLETTVMSYATSNLEQVHRNAMATLALFGHEHPGLCSTKHMLQIKCGIEYGLIEYL